MIQTMHQLRKIRTEKWKLQRFSPEGPQLHFPAEKASLLSCNVDHRYPTRIPTRVAFTQLRWQRFVS